MKFEEQFPTLKGFNFIIDGRIHTHHVQEYCLDKAKVKKAIFLCYQKLYLSQDSLEHNKVMSDYMGELEKELGLE